MTSTPLVSVLTPVYNGAKYLDECIRSVRDQTYHDWEYQVVDNQSTDASAEIAEKHAREDSRIRLIRETEFVSIYRNHNRALRRIAEGSRYCKFIHADDWLFPECLERMVKVGEKNPSVGLVSAFRMVGADVDGDGLFQPGQSVMKGSEVVARTFVDAAVVTGSPSSLLYRSEIVRGGSAFFDEDFWHSDTDAANRVLMSWDCGFVPQVLSFTRLHPEALTARSFRINTWIANEGRLLIRYGSTLANAHYRRLARAFLARYAWFLAKQMLRPPRSRDLDFQQFHRHEIDAMIRETAHDAETRRALRLLRHLLIGSSVPNPAAYPPPTPAARSSDARVSCGRVPVGLGRVR